MRTQACRASSAATGFRGSALDGRGCSGSHALDSAGAAPTTETIVETHIQLAEDTSAAERIVALAEFVMERKEAILAGAYDIEIADIGEGSLLDLVSFGISARQGVRFKLNIDFQAASA
jgi:hypothetical protein